MTKSYLRAIFLIFDDLNKLKVDKSLLQAETLSPPSYPLSTSWDMTYE